jgi:protein-disulfide isomerase
MRSIFDRRCIRIGLVALTMISLMACASEGQSGQPQSPTKRVAVVNGEAVTEDQVRKAASDELEELELRRLQAEAGFKRDEQSAYDKALSNIIDERVIAAEAKKRNITPQALMAAEVESKLQPIPDKDVTAFYEANKSRIPVTGDEALRQVRVYLTQQNRDGLYQAFVNKLRKEYKVESFVEPARVQLATQGFPSKGPANAPVTIVEFSDFECPYCASIFPTLKQIEAAYGDRVRVVFRQFPLNSIHPRAQKAAEASLCAAEQQKFWEMHDAMFQDPRNLGIDALKQKASSLKLDATAFNACLDNSAKAESVKKDIFEGVKAGVTGTPALFINGRFLNGAQPYAQIAKVIDEELQRK